jgi:hypothetical protein
LTVRLLRLIVTISLGESLYAQVGTSEHGAVVVDWAFDYGDVVGTSVCLCAPTAVISECCAQQTDVHRIVGSNCLIVYLPTEHMTSIYVRSTFPTSSPPRRLATLGLPRLNPLTALV